MLNLIGKCMENMAAGRRALFAVQLKDSGCSEDEYQRWAEYMRDQGDMELYRAMMQSIKDGEVGDQR